MCLLVFTVFERTIFESKSQLWSIGLPVSLSIYSIRKNNIWKQITTFGCSIGSGSKVFTVFERTIFESKSQLYGTASKN